MSSREQDDPLATPEAAKLRQMARGTGDASDNHAGPPQDAGGLDAGFEALQRRIAAEQAAASRAKALSTPARIVLGSSGVLALAMLAGIAMPRADLAGCAFSKLTLTLGTTAALVAIAIALGFRPLHRPPLPAWTLPALVGATAAGLAVCYFACPVAVSASTGLGSAAGCALVGTAAALPLLALLLVLDRGGSPGGIALAAAAGAAANTTLLLHCGDASMGHMLVGHAAVVLIVAMGYLVGSRVFGNTGRTGNR